MAQITPRNSVFTVAPLLLLLSGCAEVKALFTVVFTKATSLSTSAFEFDDLRSGAQVTCALLADKSLRCVGSGEKGNLGTFNGGPAVVESPVKLVATGNGFTCVAAGPAAKLYCFGRNDKGQLGNATAGNSIKAVQVNDVENNGAAITEVKELTAGESHACALLKSGRTLCWGDNSFGQLGNVKQAGSGARTVLENERTLKPLTGVKSVVAGANSTCLIAREDSTVFCFGERFEVQNKVNWIPERVELSGSAGFLSGIKQIGVGRGFGCALSGGSKVYCWGRNEANQLGLLATSPGLSKAVAVEVSYPQESEISKIEQISVGDSHACALHRDEKTVYCWGRNSSYQLGNSSDRGYAEQVAIGSNNLTLKGVKEVRAGADRTCVVSLRDETYCWGNGAHGILGNAKPFSIYPSAALDLNRETLSGSLHLSVGGDHSCMIDQHEKLYCFGMNQYGQLGTNVLSGAVIKADEKPIQRVIAYDTQGGKTCVVYGEDQSLGCFGDRTLDPQIETNERNSFVVEDLRKNGQPLKGVIGASVGKNEICAIESDQTVTCFPRIEKEALPTQLLDLATKKPLRDIWQLRARGAVGCALAQETGVISCWPQETLSQTSSAQPVRVKEGSGKEFIQIAVTNEQVCGVQGAERRLLCGDAADLTTKTVELSPMTSTSGLEMKGIVGLTGGMHHFCAVNESGKLFCWGRNENAQFGAKAPLSSVQPLEITLHGERFKRIARVAAGDAHTCISTPDDPALYCFGESFFHGPDSADPLEYPL